MEGRGPEDGRVGVVVEGVDDGDRRVGRELRDHVPVVGREPPEISGRGLWKLNGPGGVK